MPTDYEVTSVHQVRVYTVSLSSPPPLRHPRTGDLFVPAGLRVISTDGNGWSTHDVMPLSPQGVYQWSVTDDEAPWAFEIAEALRGRIGEYVR